MPTNENLIVISTEEEIRALIAKLRDKEYISLDSETTGVHKDCEVVGLSVCAELHEAYYIIAAIWDKETKQLIRLPTDQAIKDLLTLLLSKSLILHNAIFDVEVLHRQYGIFLMPAVHTDTMCLAHLLNENISAALKERAYVEFGEDSKKEQEEMQKSVITNGGRWEKKRGGEKDMYMADPFILGYYGAKDALLTLKLFYLYIPQLYDQNLDTYFYNETMPLFRGPTYDLNTHGIKIDTAYLQQLESDLTQEIHTLTAKVLFDIQPYIKDKYPGTNKKNTFNIGASQQVAWLLFVHLQNEWFTLTDGGKVIAKEILGKLPYSLADKRQFTKALLTYTNAKGKGKKLEQCVKCDKKTLSKLKKKHEWVDTLLKLRAAEKLLSTYVLGIKSKLRYGILYPSFLQCGTKGTRYSSRNPNGQNLPRDDKRIKKMFIARPGKVFVGGDEDQLEVRVFASFAQDERLLAAFTQGLDPYSIVGMDIFAKTDCSPYKEGRPDAFGVKYKAERQAAKNVLLAATYGVNKFRLSDMIDRDTTFCQSVIDDYFEQYPKVKQLQLNSHKEAIANGVVYSLLGRPRHLPEAKFIKKLGHMEHSDLPYDLRTVLNSAVNSRIQMTAGEVLNRSAVMAYNMFKEKKLNVSIVLQVHDELILECDEDRGEEVRQILQHCMETAVSLPGVALKCSPKIAKTVADLK